MGLTFFVVNPLNWKLNYPITDSVMVRQKQNAFERDMRKVILIDCGFCFMVVRFKETLERIFQNRVHIAGHKNNFREFIIKNHLLAEFSYLVIGTFVHLSFRIRRGENKNLLNKLYFVLNFNSSTLSSVLFFKLIFKFPAYMQCLYILDCYCWSCACGIINTHFAIE